jgi:hypothetical protein
MAHAKVRFEYKAEGTLEILVEGFDLSPEPISTTVSWHKHQAVIDVRRHRNLHSSGAWFVEKFEEVQTRDRFEVRFEPPVDCHATAHGPHGQTELKEPAITFFLEHLDPLA